MKKTCIPAVCGCIAALLVLGIAGVSAARGIGIKAGEGRLHPAIDLDFIYDTNPGYINSSSDALASDLILRIRPGLNLSFPSSKVSFELTGKVGYDYYFGIEKSATNDFSTISGEADMRVGFNPEGQVSFFIEDNFSRTGDPRHNTLSGRFDRTDNEAKAHLQIKPGGGALMFDVAYGFFLDLFDQTDQGNSEALTSYGHRIYFSGKWKFLPKTAVTLDFDADLRRYPNAYSDGPLAGQKNVDVNAIRATVGMLGQISPTIGLTVKVGYGDSLLPSGYAGDDFRSVVGQAEINFRSGTTYVSGGYSRNFQPVGLFVYFGHDKIYARFRQQIMAKFTLSADLSFGYLTYGEAILPGTDNKPDGVLDGKLAFNYHIQDWVEVGLAYYVQARVTNRTQPGGMPAEYNKHMFTLHVGVDYSPGRRYTCIPEG
jgi:hypothetical protein